MKKKIILSKFLSAMWIPKRVNKIFPSNPEMIRTFYTNQVFIPILLISFGILFPFLFSFG
jgi:hypothetical protein